MDTEKLMQEVDPAHIQKREAWKGGPKLSYLPGWRVINKANEIFGFDGWNSELKELADVKTWSAKNEKGQTVHYSIYRAVVRVTVEGEKVSSREGVGFGNGISYHGPDAAIELAMKEAETDAMKRAFRTFGAQFGNSLYDKDNPLHNETPKAAPTTPPAAATGRTEPAKPPQTTNQCRCGKTFLGPGCSNHAIRVKEIKQVKKWSEAKQKEYAVIEIDFGGRYPVSVFPNIVHDIFQLGENEHSIDALLGTPFLYFDTDMNKNIIGIRRHGDSEWRKDSTRRREQQAEAGPEEEESYPGEALDEEYEDDDPFKV